MIKKIQWINYIYPFLVIIIPSSRVFYKYLPIFNSFGYLLYVLFFIFFIYYLCKGNFSRIINFLAQPKVIALFVLILTAATLIIYPIADSLKYEMRGSDQDDCIILSVKQLLQFSNPYIEESYHGNQFSCGFGILILYFPFVITGIYPLGSIIGTLFAAFSLKNITRNINVSIVFSFFIFTSFAWLELTAVGSDLNFIGCGLLILSYGISKNVINKNPNHLLFLSVFAGLLSSSRINFLMIPPLIAFLIFKYWRKGAIVFLVVSLIVAIVPSAFIYSLNPDGFAPFHLIEKSSNLLPLGIKETAIFLTLISAVVAYRLSIKSPQNIPKGIFITLLPSLSFLSFGELYYFREGNLSNWEGANYFIPLIPLAISFISINSLKTLNHKNKSEKLTP